MAALELSEIARAKRKNGKPSTGYVAQTRWVPGDANATFPTPSIYAVNPWSWQLWYPYFPEVVWSKFAWYATPGTRAYVPQAIWGTQYVSIITAAITRARQLNFKLGVAMGSGMATGPLLKQLGQPDTYEGETDEERKARAALSYGKDVLMRVERDPATQLLYWRLSAGLSPAFVLSRTKDATGTAAKSIEAVWQLQESILTALGGAAGIQSQLMPWSKLLNPKALAELVAALDSIPDDLAAKASDAGPAGTPWADADFSAATIEGYAPSWPWERNAYGEPSEGVPPGRYVPGEVLVSLVSGTTKPQAEKLIRQSGLQLGRVTPSGTVVLTGAGDPPRMAEALSKSPVVAWSEPNWLSHAALGGMLDDAFKGLKKAGRSISRAAVATFADPLGAPERIVKEARRSTGKALIGAGKGLLSIDDALGGGIIGTAGMQAVIAIATPLLIAVFPPLAAVQAPLLAIRFFPGASAVLLKEGGEFIKDGDTEFDFDRLAQELGTDVALLALEAAIVVAAAGALGIGLGSTAAVLGTAGAIGGKASLEAKRRAEEEARRKALEEAARRDAERRAKQGGGSALLIGGAALGAVALMS